MINGGSAGKKRAVVDIRTPDTTWGEFINPRCPLEEEKCGGMKPTLPGLDNIIDSFFRSPRLLSQIRGSGVAIRG